MKIGKLAAGLMVVAMVAGIARTAKAQTPAEEQAAEDSRQAEAASTRHRADLMKIPHVKGVTGEVDGQNEAAILVEVDEQKNIEAVTRQLPSQIEGFPVEIDTGDEPTEGGFSAFGSLAAATPTPATIDKMGIYHHTWIPATKPGAQQ